MSFDSTKFFMHIKSMSNQFFFGYGSLVNTSSHNFHNISNARLVGWRRVWQRTNLRDFSFLSVHRSDNFSIDGVIALVPDGNWRKLDEREAGYDRIIGSEMIEHTSLKSDSISFYRIPDHKFCSVEKCPILLSYLDVVLMGFLQRFGKQGFLNFFETTDGWDCGVFNDRNNPRYPRAQEYENDFYSSVDNAITDREITLYL